MATEVLLPKLDMTMTEGTLIRWHKREGDLVKDGDLLFEVEADKLNMDIEATSAGTLAAVAYPAGSRLAVGTVVAYILAAGEVLPVDSTEDRVRATPAARRIAQEQGIDLATVTGSGPNGRIHADDVEQAKETARVTPLAQKVATELGVQAAAIAGTGPSGKVMKADVLRAATPAAASPTTSSEPERVVLKGARAIIASRMSQSWQQSPHVTLTLEADCAELVRLRSRLAETTKFSYNTLIAWLTAKALINFPNANSVWDGPDLLRSSTVHLAVAVDTPNGLLVPVVRDAQSLGLQALQERLVDLVSRAKIGKVVPSELSGGTFTVSNLGNFGVEGFTPIINPPQVAILGVGALIDKVVPHDGAIVIRPRISLSLSFDHRAMDGADGARFLAHLRSLIEAPERTLL